MGIIPDEFSRDKAYLVIISIFVGGGKKTYKTYFYYMILHNEKRAAVRSAPPPVEDRILECLLVIVVVGIEVFRGFRSFCCFPFQIVQLSQTAAESLPLVGVHL